MKFEQNFQILKCWWLDADKPSYIKIEIIPSNYFFHICSIFLICVTTLVTEMTFHSSDCTQSHHATSSGSEWHLRQFTKIANYFLRSKRSLLRSNWTLTSHGCCSSTTNWSIHYFHPTFLSQVEEELPMNNGNGNLDHPSSSSSFFSSAEFMFCFGNWMGSCIWSFWIELKEVCVDWISGVGLFLLKFLGAGRPGPINLFLEPKLGHNLVTLERPISLITCHSYSWGKEKWTGIHAVCENLMDIKIY